MSEFATLIVARQWSQQFEWSVHVPLALKAGTAQETITALQQGRRPTTLSAQEAQVYDFVTELSLNKGVCDATYRDCVESLGEAGVVELTSLVGYFVLISMVLNVAHIPAEQVDDFEALPPLPR